MFDNVLPAGQNATDLTIEKAIDIVATWADLTASRRRDLTSALASAAKLVGLPAASVVLTPASLRDALLSRSASVYGLKEGTMRNIVSSLRIVLRRLGVIDPIDTPTTPAWAALLGTMPKYKSSGLISFARYCSATSVEPSHVTDDVLEQFKAWLEDRTITVRPIKFAGETRSAWNRAASSIEGWPQRKLNALPVRGQYILPLDAFPPSFAKDLELFCERLGGQSMDAFFEDTGNGEANTKSGRKKFSRPISVRMRADHCRWAASALVATGVPPSDIVSLSTLVSSLDRVQAIVRYIYFRAGKRPSAAGGHIVDVLRMVAKHHVRPCPDFALNIAKMRNKVGLDYKQMTDKNRQQVRQMMDPDHMARFLQLPDALMQAARQLRLNAPKQAAAIALRAVAIDLLTVCPIRLSNLIGIQLDQHLRRANPPRGPITDLYFPAHEVKNDSAIDMPVPESTAAFLQEWITNFRPAVAPAGCRYLFPGHGIGNRAMTPQGMRDAIRQATEQHVGVVLTPHQFRHLAAHIHLDENPGNYEEVSRLLGHNDPGTAYKSYCGQETKAAVSRYGSSIDQRRKSLRSANAKAKKKPTKSAVPIRAPAASKDNGPTKSATMIKRAQPTKLTGNR